MEVSETLRTVYSATVEQQDGQYYVSIPARKIDTGSVDTGETYRVALLQSTLSTNTTAKSGISLENSSTETRQLAGLPVEAGDLREVEIETIGDQGDGIAKIDRGYVVIIPDTDVGDQVTVEIEQAQENVAFATIVE